MTVSKKQIMAALSVALTVAAVNAFAYTGEEFVGQAKVSMEQARASALKTHPGNISDEELKTAATCAIGSTSSTVSVPG